MSRASETMQLSSERTMRELIEISFKQLLCELEKKAKKKHKLMAERTSVFLSFLVGCEGNRKTHMEERW